MAAAARFTKATSICQSSRCTAKSSYNGHAPAAKGSIKLMLVRYPPRIGQITAHACTAVNNVERLPESLILSFRYMFPMPAWAGSIAPDYPSGAINSARYMPLTSGNTM